MQKNPLRLRSAVITCLHQKRHTSLAENCARTAIKTFFPEEIICSVIFLLSKVQLRVTTKRKANKNTFRFFCSLFIWTMATWAFWLTSYFFILWSNVCNTEQFEHENKEFQLWGRPCLLKIRTWRGRAVENNKLGPY